ncbi:MAG TPA: DUF6754 domain-containing protein [Anaerolineae bacterium]|nr:DUF6754 domain-containing protein [Anaerolineae bacterium]
MTLPQLIGLLALLVFAIGQVFLITSISTGLRPRFRSIPLFSLLRGQTGRAIESGRELHVSIGTGGISGDDVTTTLAGLQIVEYLADEAAASGISPIITTADPAALLLAEDTLRRPYIRQGDLSSYQPLSARLPALNAVQYAAATMDYLAHENALANVMSGSFGPEIGLIEHESAKQDLLKINAAADPRALAVLSTTSEHLLIGEEMFAAKAYLQARPAQLASLRAQDIVRVAIVIGIVVLFILSMVTRL